LCESKTTGVIAFLSLAVGDGGGEVTTGIAFSRPKADELDIEELDATGLIVVLESPKKADELDIEELDATGPGLVLLKS
jgi:hypothetical protein